MHPHSAAEAAALASAHYGVYANLVLMSGPENIGSISGTGLDFLLGYNPLVSARISADLDQPVMSAEFRLNLGKGSKNLSPLMNVGAKQFGRSILDPGQYLNLYTKCVANAPLPFSAAWNAIPYRPCFTGRIDSADPAEDDNDVVVVRCRDIYADLLDTWIEPGPAGGWPLPGGIIQAHLFNMLDLVDRSTRSNPLDPTSGTEFSKRHVAITGAPTLGILPYNQQPGSTLQSMRDAVLQSGWDLRGKYGSFGVGQDGFALTCYEPNRTLLNPYVITPSRYISLRGLEKSRMEVRNVIEVTPAGPDRTPIKQVDETSVLRYGRRYLGISEDATSNIITVAQALALNNAIMLDLREPKVGGLVTMRFHPFIEINDVVQLNANQVHHDTNLVVAVSGFEHTLTTNEDGSTEELTTLRTRATPAAANKEWRDKQSPKMQYTGTGPPNFRAAQGARYTEL